MEALLEAMGELPYVAELETAVAVRVLTDEMQRALDDVPAVLVYQLLQATVRATIVVVAGRVLS